MCENGTCIQTFFGYRCDCDPGYVEKQSADYKFTSYCAAEDKTNSAPIDACSDDPCSGANCLAKGEGFICECFPGYSRTNTTTCTDINECMDEHLCTKPNEICINHPGNYECVCKPGYQTSNENSECFDIDECLIAEQEGMDLCGFNDYYEEDYGELECTNTIGSYYCSKATEIVLPAMTETVTKVCSHGFKFVEIEGRKECLDINECLSMNCPEGSFCVNTMGGYQCLDKLN